MCLNLLLSGLTKKHKYFSMKRKAYKFLYYFLTYTELHQFMSLVLIHGVLIK